MDQVKIGKFIAQCRNEKICSSISLEFSSHAGSVL